MAQRVFMRTFSMRIKVGSDGLDMRNVRKGEGASPRWISLGCQAGFWTKGGGFGVMTILERAF
ncbi:MAG: hypothetical protein ACJAQT_002086 [Akkermansiaceae bacterium]|jgi:hypothetical protein